MITVDKEKVKVNGNIAILMAEVALMLSIVSELAEKQGFLTKEKAKETILESIIFKDLMKAGMTEKEAREVMKGEA